MIPALIALALSAAEAPVKVEADSSAYNLETRRVQLEGHVRLTRPANEGEPPMDLSADRIDGYLDGPVHATGDLHLTAGALDADAEEGEYDVTSSTGYLEKVAMVRDSVYVRAERVEIEGPDRYVILGTDVTTCNLVPPHYHIHVGRAVYRGKILRGYGSTLYIGRIPVFWFPFVPFEPGVKKPSFHLRVGRSGFEGAYTKLEYPYSLGRAGNGAVKLDWRSRRGWAYGVDHFITLPEGWLKTDLYRSDERRAPSRGVARFGYHQDWSDRWTGRGDIYYLTDGRFLQDYRFRDFASDPDPITTGSVSYRGDGVASMLRVVTNLNRGDYDLIERLPEARVLVTPRRHVTGVYLDGSAGIAIFRHSHPYDSGVTALYFRQHPAEAGARLQEFGRGDVNVTIKRPFQLARSWVFTPYGTYEGIAYSEDTVPGGSRFRSIPAFGVTLAGFERFRVADGVSWQVRPVLDMSERPIFGPLVGQTPIVEHIDQIRDQRPLKIVLDQGLLTRSGRRWTERMRLRSEGGFDFDRSSAEHERFLPVTTKLWMLLPSSFHFDGELTVDPNRGVIRDARAELTHETRRLKTAASYFRRNPTPGLPDLENVSGSVVAELNAKTSAEIAGSFDIDKRRLSFARYGVTRRLHDFVVHLETTDQRLLHRVDVRASVELVFP